VGVSLAPLPLALPRTGVGPQPPRRYPAPAAWRSPPSRTPVTVPAGAAGPSSRAGHPAAAPKITVKSARACGLRVACDGAPRHS